MDILRSSDEIKGQYRFALGGVTVSFIALLLFFGLNFVVSIYEDKAEDKIRQTLNAKANIQALLSLISKAQAGQRSYVITQDEAYLEPHIDAMRVIEPTFEKLYTALAWSDQQRASLDRLKSLAAQKLSRLARNIDLVKNGRVDQALSNIRSGFGRNANEAIEAEGLSLDASLNGKLLEDQQALSNYLFLSFASDGLSVFIFVIALIYARKTVNLLNDLKISEGKFRVLYQRSSDAHLIMDLEDATVIDCNAAAEEILRGTREQIIGKAAYELSPERQPSGKLSKEMALEKTVEIRNNGGARFEWIHQRLNGEEFRCDVNISIVDYDHRSAMLVTWRDMTEWMEAKARIIELSNMLQTVMDNMPSAIFWKARDGSFLGCNRAFLKDTGLKNPEDIVGLTDYDMPWAETHADDYRRDDLYVMESGRKKLNFEEGQLNAAGDTVWVRTNKLPLTNAEGEIIGLLGTYEDITENKAAEETLATRTALLRQAEETAKVGHWFYNALDTSLFWSEQTYIIHGLTPDMYEPNLDTAIDLYHPEERDAIREIVQRAIENKNPYSHESRIIKHGGEVINVLTTGEPKFNDAGEVTALFGTFQDVTEQKQVKLEREEFIERLARSNEELERFAFICSHDLQEPLRMIRSFSEKLQQHLADRFEDDEKGARYFEFITEGAARAQDMISGILSYSSIEGDTRSLEKTDLTSLVAAIKLNASQNLRETDGDLIFGDLPTVRCIKIQFHQLFYNLINNGLKYQKPGNAPRVEISYADKQSHWEFSVKDNGIGMEERHLKKIFDVFQRLHRQNEYAGTGIGLSICKKVVERHGGIIWVESTVGEGTIVSFTLPK